MSYPKPPTKLSEQLELLSHRGMRLTEQAEHYLSHIGYYRLRGYWIPFEDPSAPDGDHRFQSGTTFDDVLNLYIFDRELRLLVIDAIERIEVSVRNQWQNVLGLEHGAHAYLKSELFHSARQYGRCLAELSSEYERSKETHIKHYRKKYEKSGNPDLPPIWSAVEIMTLGQFSHWLSNLKPKSLKGKIAKPYGLDEAVLCSFLHHLTVIRNICAHHARLWNRSMTITMQLPRTKPKQLAKVIDHGTDPNQAPRKIYNTFVMIAWFMDCICSDNHFRQRLIHLIDKHGVDTGAMGFPDGWHSMAFWQQTEDKEGT